MDPILKSIPGFPGYSASDTGKIFSHFVQDKFNGQRTIDNSTIVELSIQSRKEAGRAQIRPYAVIYRRVPSKPPKRVKMLISRAVALAFLPNPLKYTHVRHKNDISTDNRLENIMWGTNRHNVSDRQRNQTRDLLIKELEYKLNNLSSTYLADNVSREVLFKALCIADKEIIDEYIY